MRQLLGVHFFNCWKPLKLSHQNGMRKHKRPWFENETDITMGNRGF